MNRLARLPLPAAALVAALAAAPASLDAAGRYTLTGWNNLGMHCMDGDYTVFAILPPYNTIQAQLVDPSGHLVRDPAGIAVTYEAVADASGSINRTSRGKTEFWTWVADLFGVALADDAGLAGNAMPGSTNRPRPMTWDAASAGWIAEGVPITPYDDGGRVNPYPMMRLVARDAAGTVLAQTDIVLPVSDEMSCARCHASGSAAAARPAAGWVGDGNPAHDFRRNVLRLHDERQAASDLYRSTLGQAGYDLRGLEATAAGGHPVLCARCHASNALPGTGYGGVPPLTRSVHALHAGVVDPQSGATLGAAASRDACYTCHPGSATRCLRGAMGSAVAADGTLAIQCQSCHGAMAAVGGAREGWLDEPDCQSCHTGTATANAGAIRFTSAFTAAGELRQPVDARFATQSDVPVPGSSLYRASRGHGGLACPACHGSTHAELPSSHANDNVQSVALQGHPGMLAECARCHGTVPTSAAGGPHGMHAIGPLWAEWHGDAVERSGADACRACHGADLTGTVLSRALGDWTWTGEMGSRFFWRGFRIGCWSCHDGPSSESATRDHAPLVVPTAISGASGAPIAVAIAASDPDGDALALRVVSQPAHGTVALSGRTATYRSESDFRGADVFTVAAWDGRLDSNLASVAVDVAGPLPCTLTCGATAPTSAAPGGAVAFRGSATATACSAATAWSWTFGDGGGSAVQNPTHAYAAPGGYDWRLAVTVPGTSCVASGRIAVVAPAPPPAITGVTKIARPFTLVLGGSGFVAGLRVEIAGGAWSQVAVAVPSRVTIQGGNALAALFPARTWVRVRVVNPDGQAAAVEIRRDGSWRPAA